MSKFPIMNTNCAVSFSLRLTKEAALFLHEVNEIINHLKDTHILLNHLVPKEGGFMDLLRELYSENDIKRGFLGDRLGVTITVENLKSDADIPDFPKVNICGDRRVWISGLATTLSFVLKKFNCDLGGIFYFGWTVPAESLPRKDIDNQSPGGIVLIDTENNFEIIPMNSYIASHLLSRSEENNTVVLFPGRFENTLEEVVKKTIGDLEED